jgi:hypothetical protein
MWKLINGPPSLPSLFLGTARLSRKCNSGASSRYPFSKRRHSSKSKRKQSTYNKKKLSHWGVQPEPSQRQPVVQPEDTQRQERLAKIFNQQAQISEQEPRQVKKNSRNFS